MTKTCVLTGRVTRGNLFFEKIKLYSLNLLKLLSVLVVGSKDMSSRVHACERFKNLICYVLGSHNEAIVGCFFEKNSLNVCLGFF